MGYDPSKRRTSAVAIQQAIRKSQNKKKNRNKDEPKEVREAKEERNKRRSSIIKVSDIRVGVPRGAKRRV